MKGASVLLLLAALTALALAGTPCTNDDYVGTYTQCRVDNTRDFVYYLKSGVTCDPQTGIPPANSFGVPCNIACKAGQYLQNGASSCSDCAAGTYSTAGMTDVDEWNVFPTEMGAWTTFCVQNSIQTNPVPSNAVCHQWKPTGPYIEVANVTGDAASILQLTTTLLTDGNITFTMYVEYVYNLGVYIKIDNAAPVYVPTEALDFSSYTYQLTSGVHTIQWQFASQAYSNNPTKLARISDIEIYGLQYTATECTPCPPGTYTNVTGTATCKNCPVNTISTAWDTVNCAPCPAGQYAYPGDSSCTPKVPCNASHTVTLIGACSTSNTATATTTYLEPVVCDTTAYSLPPPQSSACAPCNPGTDLINGQCQSCPAGQYSAGGTTTTCSVCAGGTVPATQLDVKSWHTFGSSMSTNCTGECGTNGWRLGGSYIDSGLGHGDKVSSNLYWTFTLTSPGTLSFNRSLFCSLGCTLVVIYGTQSYERQNFQSNAYFAGPVVETLNIGEAGTHTVIFSLTQDIDPVTAPATKVQERTARAVIFEMSVTNAVNGAATGCTNCPTGQVSSNGACSVCAAGTAPSSDKTSCQACTGNTYSKGNGDACHACGAGTTATADHSDCQWTCSGTVNGASYDINQVQAYMPSYGPYEYSDWTDFIFVYISPCDRAPMNGADGGQCPESYACAGNQDGGYQAEMVQLSDNPYDGVQVHFFNGAVTPSCPNGQDLYVKFTCHPEMYTNFNYTIDPSGVLRFPTDCTYHTEFQSAYGCPVCSMNDVGFFYTDCFNGIRTKTYYWLEPQRCNNYGINTYPPLFTLPQPENVSCSDSTTVCPPGQYLASAATGCLACDAGTYSDGGQFTISSWSTLPAGFFTICSSVSCSKWSTVQSDQSIIRSGAGTSSIIADLTLKQSGSVQFDYKMWTKGDGVFQFLVDGVVHLNHSANEVAWVPYSYPITNGAHQFTWTFTGGELLSPSQDNFEAAYIRNVVFTGYDYHADTCTPCPAGSVSAAGATSCTLCPANTYSEFPTTPCAPCDNTTYSDAGSQFCNYAEPCDISNYDTIYGECDTNGERTVTLSPKQPFQCQDVLTHTQPSVACAPCPASTYRVNGGGPCIGCPVGQYYSSGSCLANPKGNTVQRSISYFVDNSMSSWPAEFTTGCSGNCISSGWHIGNGVIDSGYHYDYAVDSYVTLSTTLAYDGSIEFNYTLTNTNTDGTNGFFFLVDNVITQIPTQQSSSSEVYVKLPLAAGSHQITWDYHQDSGFDIVTVHNIIVNGASNSILTGASVPCPAGQFSDDANNVLCSICPAGTFAQNTGNTACTPCNAGEYAVFPGSSSCSSCGAFAGSAAAGSEVCQPTCNFNFNNGEYVLPFNTSVTTLNGKDQFYINVCGFTPQCPNSHICVASGANLIPFGSSFIVQNGTTTGSSAAFSILFENGDSPSCPQNATSTIDFFCEPGTTDSTPSVNYADGCSARLSWLTASACRVCQDSDYEEVVGVCSGGHRAIVKNRKVNCNGPLTIQEASRKCNSKEFPTGAVVAVVVVFVVVVAVAIAIFVRHRIIAKRYSSLLDETKSHGMKSTHSAVL